MGREQAVRPSPLTTAGAARAGEATIRRQIGCASCVSLCGGADLSSRPPIPMNTAVLAEKPSVARDLARVLGAARKGDGYLEGNGWIVTWAIGHLVRLPEPHQIDERWKRWSRETLPISPARWPSRRIISTRSAARR